ncbi:AarF/UbiB family protein [Opitutaceae bacterium]|nr:AarF/UbiB family protein [Opitutaceae bacterium]MDB4474278.1 AarF/UbiB family protein [Opitutaceae bacterium]
MIVETHRNTRLGFSRSLSPAERDQLIDHLGKSASAPADPLQGRAQVDFMNLPSWGAIVVKSYMRGGLIRHISHRHHLRSSQSRGEAEFRMLQSLRENNLPVPEPLGWAEQGRLWVQTWLFLAEIPNARTLAEISRSDHKRAAMLLAGVSKLIDRLCDLEIHHVDLHPGNVLVDNHDKVFLIDFDKAAPTTESTKALRDRCYRRWNRAIAKHSLSSGLNLPLLP